MPAAISNPTTVIYQNPSSKMSLSCAKMIPRRPASSTTYRGGDNSRTLDAVKMSRQQQSSPLVVALLYGGQYLPMVLVGARLPACRAFHGDGDSRMGQAELLK